jgi:hypothetical protein
MAKSKAITRVSLKEALPIRRRNKQVEEAAAAGANCVEHEETASGLTIHRAGHKQLATLRTLDTLEIYTPYLGGGIMRPHFGQTASSDACTFSRLTFRELGMVRGEISPTCCPLHGRRLLCILKWSTTCRARVALLNALLADLPACAYCRVQGDL